MVICCRSEMLFLLEKGNAEDIRKPFLVVKNKGLAADTTGSVEVANGG